jgi:hypothetical protein
LVVLLTPWALERPYVWIELGASWGRRIPRASCRAAQVSRCC